jgi:ABC-type Fe3+ transport system permease subunit
MRVVETVLAGLLALGGIRSLWYWSRRRFEGADLTDHLLYALFVAGRVGLWFAFCGLFAIYASNEARGRAAVDELTELRWYFAVLLVLAGVQFAAGYFLGRRQPG